jgi:hypothetical protein
MNTYETRHTALCPNGELKDHYDIKVESGEIIPVEFIIQALKELPQKAYQEDIADNLRAKLGASVTVVGWHFSVKITSYRP